MNAYDIVVYRIYLALLCRKYGKEAEYPKLVKLFRLEK
jgi:hypothetical protein